MDARRTLAPFVAGVGSGAAGKVSDGTVVIAMARSKAGAMGAHGGLGARQLRFSTLLRKIGRGRLGRASATQGAQGRKHGREHDQQDGRRLGSLPRGCDDVAHFESIALTRGGHLGGKVVRLSRFRKPNPEGKAARARGLVRKDTPGHPALLVRCKPQ